MNEYFEEIAVSHRELRHTQDKPAYFREYSSAKIMLDNSDFLAKLRMANDTILVSQFNGDRRSLGSLDGNTVAEHGAIFLLERVSVKDYTGIDTAREKLTGIWEDILAKMKKDIRERALQIWNLDWQIIPVGAIGDGYYGISVLISFERGECVRYDEGKWEL